MTPRLMLALAALVPALGWAQSVSLHGLLGRQALLIVDGKAPRAVAPGQTHLGITVLSTDEDRAVVALAGGQRLTLRVGESPVSVGGAPAPGGSDRVALSADARGHFITPGSINHRPTQFMVDTGASVVAIGQAEADRLGLNYRTGQPVTLRTANGTAPGWALRLATVRIGDVTAYEVDAVVTPSAMPAVLLGNSFLNRFSMRRDGDTMMLIKR